MPNRLADETSPYLLQHAENPVDWYPWGPEALEKAKREDKPILLSIGYAACHWCHVMAHESFENEDTARLMNERFVNIKVDREERPDLDGIYMQAVQAMTGHGGWPMTMFLMPDGTPFYGGTYFPPDDRHGMPSFRRVLHAASDAYRDRRDGVAQSAAQLRRIYEANLSMARSPGVLTPQILESAYAALVPRYDATNGGFGGAPKFPATMVLDFLLRFWKRSGTGEALDVVVTSFRKMARGGIYDQIGGGFARYSVDASWLVPHFEKMLYDNALLTRAYLHGYLVTGEARYRRVVEETVEYVLRDLRHADGGFSSAEDADSEGIEGKFYLWSKAEIEELCGDDVREVIRYYGVTEGGNFLDPHTGYRGNILHVVDRTEPRPAAVERARAVLFEARRDRVRPGLDDKVLLGWNAL
ncbi:MAG: thioredoxin domain-containing protein, partial [Gemmatimonadaceae bacterium]